MPILVAPQSFYTTNEWRVFGYQHAGRDDGRGGLKPQEDTYFCAPSSVQNASQARDFLKNLFSVCEQGTAYRLLRQESPADNRFRDPDGKIVNYQSISGSTASIALITPDGYLTTAHIGDSPIMLLAFNNGMKLISGYDLAVPHTPLHPDEFKRIKKATKYAPAEKLIFYQPHEVNPNYTGSISHLAISRAFGDNHFEGVTAEPTITSFNLKKFLGHGRLVMCIGSDGITQRDEIIDAMAWGQALTGKKGLLRSKQFIPYLGTVMWEESTKGASDSYCDNVTFLLTEISLQSLSSPIIVGVFDGHGGATTALRAQQICLEKLRPSPHI